MPSSTLDWFVTTGPQDSTTEDGGFTIDSTEETEEERLKREAEEEEARRKAEEEAERIRLEAEQRKQQQKETVSKSSTLDWFKEKPSPKTTDTVPTAPEKTYQEEKDPFMIKRKLAYGAKQEPTIAGSLYRLGKARFNSWLGDKTYKEAAREIEAERQAEIAKLFPDLINKDEDLTVMTGRMGVAIADPVTFLIPWMKFAKAGKLASVTAGSAVATGDIALREEALYGEVSPLSLGLGATLGGASSLVSSMLIPVGRQIDEAVDITTKAGTTTKPVKIYGPVEPPKVPNNLIKSFEETGEEVLTQGGLKTVQNIFTNNKNYGYLVSEYELGLVQRKNLIGDIRKLRQKRNNTKLTASDEMQIITSKKEVSEIERNLRKIYSQASDIRLKEMPKDFADLGYRNLMAALEKGILTKDFAAALMQETIRPLVGMVGGFAVGVTTADENDTMNYVYGLMATGATLGLLQKRIQVADFKVKERRFIKAFQDEGEKIYRTEYWTFLKRLSAGTQASVLQAGPEELRKFGSLMVKSQGGGVKAGVAIQDSVEEMKNQAMNYWTSVALPATIQGAREDTILAAGRILNQRNMPKTAKHSFLKEGDLRNSDAQALAYRLEHLTTEFKKYVKSVGIKMTEEDSYGLTQIASNKMFRNGEQVKKDAAEAFKIQFNNWRRYGVLIGPDQQPELKKLYNGVGGYVHRDDLDFVLDSIKAGAPKDDFNLRLNARMYEKRFVEKDSIENTNEFLKWSERKAKEYYDGHTTRRSNSIWAKEEGDNLFQNRASKDERFIITAARHFENKRVLADQEARAFMANKGYFLDDPILTFQSLAKQTIPVTEFSRVFGARGERLQGFINGIRREVYGGSDTTNNTSLKKIADKYVKDLKGTVDGYFGLHHAERSVANNETAASTVAILQALLATTKLTKVALPSFGDLIQTYKNSGFSAGFEATKKQIVRMRNEDQFRPSEALGLRTVKSKEDLKGAEKIGDVLWNNRRYNGLLDRVMAEWMIEINPANLTQRYAQEYQRKFFEIVQLGRITRFAREFAFDAGAIRAWQIGQKIGDKGKVKRSLLKELSDIGLDVDSARYLSKFKKMDDIQGDEVAERLINRAGFKSAERDALIPTVGNRRLFAASRDPSVRFLGSFLSWAQAKTTQTNALVTRLENGDAALGARMIGALSVYASIRQLQLDLNSSEAFRDDTLISESKEIDPLLTKLGDTVIFSAEVMPWYLDKAVNTIRYDYGSNPVTGLAPVLELMDDLVTESIKAGRGVDEALQEGDREELVEGLVGIGETLVPFFKDWSRSYSGLFGMGGQKKIAELKGEKYAPVQYKFEGSKPRYKNFKGGEVSEENPVPNAAPEPSERINPYTGEPYESEMERLGFKDGLLVSIGVAPVSDKEINKLKKSLKKRQAKRNGGKATRNYAKEYANYHSSEKQKKDRAHRNNANRQLKREGRIAAGDGKDVDHKDGNPRNNSPSNLTVKSKHTNRTRKFAGGMLIKALAQRQAQKFEEEMPEDAKTYRQFYRFAREQGLSHPEAVAAQASLESGHGKSELALNQNNVLGIKVQRKKEVEEQESVSMPTVEYEDGKKKVIDANFRVFDNVRDSFKGYEEKTAHERYNKAKEAESAEQYLREIQEAGYATDPNYADKTIDIMNRYSDYISPRFK